MRYIIFVLCAFALAASPAMAQTKGAAQRNVTGTNIPCDPANLLPGCRQAGGGIFSGPIGGGNNPLAGPFHELADFLSTDSVEAIALSTAIPELQDGNGQQCWMAMQAFDKVLQAHPVPLTFKAKADIEAMRLLTMAANKLCSNTSCTQVFADLTNGAQTVTGSQLGIPSLNGLCSKVPQIVVAAPVSVPIAPVSVPVVVPLPVTPTAPVLPATPANP